MPYNFGSGSKGGLSQAVSNLYASIANSAAMTYSAGVAA
ncbi:hypothetical protein ANOBCDAF_01698 [Pleomorphomonas sp. T1.2MG-36]|nr:hypothetical protein ANOBCDAF_01698 [Pleomorphomonas sp. T1.2MG-36]